MKNKISLFIFTLMLTTNIYAKKEGAIDLILNIDDTNNGESLEADFFPKTGSGGEVILETKTRDDNSIYVNMDIGRFVFKGRNLPDTGRPCKVSFSGTNEYNQNHFFTLKSNENSVRYFLMMKDVTKNGFPIPSFPYYANTSLLIKKISDATTNTINCDLEIKNLYIETASVLKKGNYSDTLNYTISID